MRIMAEKQTDRERHSNFHTIKGLTSKSNKAEALITFHEHIWIMHDLNTRWHGFPSAPFSIHITLYIAYQTDIRLGDVDSIWLVMKTNY